jgi:DNA invertase Pin-like site-specific DNA recombinase
MMMQMLGSFAEFERSMIRERTNAGLAAAREQGRVGGRPPSLTDTQCREVTEAVLSGRKTAAAMARLLRVSPATISRVVARKRLSTSAGAKRPKST